MFKEIEEFSKFFETGIRKTMDNAAPDLSEMLLPESYLNRQERIVSLAKERFLSLSKRIAFTDLEQKLFKVKIAQNDSYKLLISQIARQVVRPLLATFRKEGDASHKMLIEMVPENLKVRLERKVYSTKEYARYSKGITLSNGDPLIFVDIEEEGFSLLHTFGATVAHSKAGKNVLFVDGTCLCDIGELFASFLLMRTIEKEYARIDALLESEKSEDTIFQNLLQIECRYAERLSRYKYIFVYRKSEKDFPERLITMLKAQLPGQIMVVDNSRLVEKIAEEFGYQREDYITLNPLHIQNVYAAFGSKLGRFVYHDFLRRHGNAYWAVPKECTIGTYLVDAYRIIYQVRAEQNAFLRKIESENREHAKSYQSKKNIPPKILQAMEKSPLNQRFGFVEYDEDCDLKKVMEVEREILAFLGAYVPFVNATDNQIRFRKLGNHKALGMYYPYMKCLCIDIRHVHSFIHEFGHLIDYEYGNLSDKNSFSQVLISYRNHLLKSEQVKTLRGKYDINYYLTPTEVFARSFEIYVSKELGVKNSLLPDSFSMVYPIESADYMNAVKNYYDDFFNDYGIRKAS